MIFRIMIQPVTKSFDRSTDKKIKENFDDAIIYTTLENEENIETSYYNTITITIRKILKMLAVTEEKNNPEIRIFVLFQPSFFNY